MSTLFDQLTGTVNGLPIGAGTPYRFAEIRGLDEDADPRTSDTPRPGRDGDFPGRDLRGSRTIEVDLSLAATAADAGALLAPLRRALRGGPGEFTVTGWPGLPPLWFAGSVRRQRIPSDRPASLGAVLPQFHFYTPDPNRYAAAVTVATLDLRETVGEAATVYDSVLTYNAAIPFDGLMTPVVYLIPPLTPPVKPAGRDGMTGSIGLRNDGLYPTWMVVKVWGPCPGFVLEDSTRGRRWGFRSPTPAGQWVEVDMGAGTVLLNGTASRRADKYGGWWDLPPGDSALTFLPDQPAVGSHLEVRYRSAY